MAGTVLGDFDGNVRTGFTGWCWSPDEPTRRLVVDILFDGRVVTASIAALFRSDLLRQGFGDGRHGFELLPKVLPRTTGPVKMIEARERASGTLLGRMLFDGNEDGRWTEAITSAANRMNDVSAAYSALPSPAPSLADLDSPKIGLTASGSAPVASFVRNRPALSDIAGGKAPSRERPPSLSVIIDAIGDTPAALACLRRIARLVGSLDIELLIVGGDRDAALSAALAPLPWVRLVTAAEDQRPGDRLDKAAALARSDRLALLDTSLVTPAGLLAVTQCRAPVVIGAHISRLAQHRELEIGIEQESVSATGLRIAIDRAMLEAIGGFDGAPGLEEGYLELELALRASLLGCELLTVAEPASRFEAFVRGVA